MKRYNLSVIIVNYNTPKLLKNCVESVVKHSRDVKLEIIIVDNASRDESKNVIKKLAKNSNIRTILNKKNLGFAGANNLGIRKAGGKYILLLNPDTLMEKDILSEMLVWMDENEKTAVTSCSLENLDGTLQASGGYFPTLSRVFSWMFFLDNIPFLDWIIKPFHPYHPNSFFYKAGAYMTKPSERDWVSGAFFLLRKKALEETGAFDEDFFMYTEEVELCYRLKKRGWRVWYLPKWSIKHVGGASSTSEFPYVSEFKGVLKFFNKHKPFWQKGVVKSFMYAGSFLRIGLYFILGKSTLAKTYVKAIKSL